MNLYVSDLFSTDVEERETRPENGAVLRQRAFHAVLLYRALCRKKRGLVVASRDTKCRSRPSPVMNTRSQHRDGDIA